MITQGPKNDGSSGNKSTPHVVVIGSANVDYIARVTRRPAVGETVVGEDFTVLPGGKGANQAVAAARSGGHVSFVGAVGDDEHGSMLIKSLEADGIGTNALTRLSGPSGNAIIVVDSTGDNSIIITPGANRKVEPAALAAHRQLISTATICVLQGELSSTATEAAVNTAVEVGVRIAINLAPVIKISTRALAAADPLIVNAHEAAELLGLTSSAVEQDPVSSVHELRSRGPRSVIITLGAHGLVLVENNEVLQIPAFKVHAVDTTGAGDGFVGALTEALARGQSLPNACIYASGFAALAVTRHGAQASYPTRFEAELYIKSNTA